MDRVRDIAEAVLYEGYILWPYRRSAMKNQQRWTFGGVMPPGYAGDRPDERSAITTQALLQAGPSAGVAATVRFLHVIRRQVAAMTESGSLQQVDRLTVDGTTHTTWEEAVEREIEVSLEGSSRTRRLQWDVPAGAERELIEDADGETRGAITRSWQALEGELELSRHRVEEGLYRVSSVVTNTTAWAGQRRHDAVHHSMMSTHTVLTTDGGAFVSLASPPTALRQAAEECDNQGAWPVLIGSEDRSRVVLASPIILYDDPRIAPESPGGLYDNTEIDELLLLSVLSLPDEERDEMSATDPRAREILERAHSMSPDDFAGLHGAVRQFRRIGDGP